MQRYVSRRVTFTGLLGASVILACYFTYRAVFVLGETCPGPYGPVPCDPQDLQVESQYVTSNSGRGLAKIFEPGTYTSGTAMPAAYARDGLRLRCPDNRIDSPTYYYDGKFFGNRAPNNELSQWHRPTNTAGAFWACTDPPAHVYGANELYSAPVTLSRFLINPGVPQGQQDGVPALNFGQDDITNTRYYRDEGGESDARAITCPGGQGSRCNVVGGGFSMVNEHDFPMKYDNITGTCANPNNIADVNVQKVDREWQKVKGNAGKHCIKDVALNWKASGWAAGWIGDTGYTPYPCETGPAAGLAGKECFGGGGTQRGAPTLESGWGWQFRNQGSNPNLVANQLPYYQFDRAADTSTRRSLKFQVISERAANGENRHPGIIYQLTIRYHYITCEDAPTTPGCDSGGVMCTPAYSAAAINEEKTLIASSDNVDDVFTWSAPGGLPSPTGGGDTFRVRYNSPGVKLVTVSTPTGQSTCRIDVAVPPEIPPTGFTAFVQPQRPDGGTNEGPNSTGEPNCSGGWYVSSTADVARAPSAFNGRQVRYCWTLRNIDVSDLNPVVQTQGHTIGSINSVSDNLPAYGETESGERCNKEFIAGEGKWHWKKPKRTEYQAIYRFEDESKTYPSDPDEWSPTEPPPNHPDEPEYELDESTIETREVELDCRVEFKGNFYATYSVTLSATPRSFANNAMSFPSTGTKDAYIYVPASEVSVSKQVTSWFTNPGPAKTHEGIPEIHPGGYANYSVSVTSQPDPNLGGRTPSQLHPWAPVSYSLGDSLNQPCLQIVEGPSFRNRSSGGGSGSDPFSGPGQTDSYDLRANGVPDPNPCGDLTRVTNTASASFSSNGFSGSKSGAADVMFRLVFYPWIQAIQGSVHSNAIINMSDIGHAGRGTAPGATYIVSAGGTINAFTSEKNWLFHSDASSPNAFGYVTGGGSYGTVKWPYQEDSLWPGRRIDSAEHVRSYYGAGFNTSVVPGGNGYDLSKGNTKGQVYMVGGGTRMSGLSGYTGKGTIYVRGALYIDGNITRSGSGAARDFTHSLGIVADGPIYIAPGVTQIDALLYSSGTIQTATSRTQNVLTVNGMMIGQRFDLTGRSFVNTACKGGVTGSGSCASAGPAEMYVYMPQLLANTPPGFNNVANVIEGPPRYGGERNPTVGRY
jgi:hypothetical protein